MGVTLMSSAFAGGAAAAVKSSDKDIAADANVLVTTALLDSESMLGFVGG